MDDAGGGTRGLKPVLTGEIVLAVSDIWGCEIADGDPLGGSTGLNLIGRRGDQRTVVRVHRPHVSAERVAALQLAREAARVAGVPTAMAIRGGGGERCIRVGAHIVEVEEFIPSDQKMDSPQRFRMAIPILARLHDALVGAELPTAAEHVEFGNYLPAAETASRVAEGAHRARSLANELRPIADTADDLVHLVETVSGNVAALPVQWCHGDFWDNNVLFRRDAVVLVADFGFMGRRPRIDDLALTLYFVLWELLAAGHLDPLDAIAELVAVYDAAANRPLSDDERDALPLAIARQPLWSVGVWARELDDPDEVIAHLAGHELALSIGRDIVDSIERWRAALRPGPQTQP